MSSSIKPIAVLYADTTQEGLLIFLGRTGEIVVQDYISELLQILKFCNGLNTQEEVWEKVRNIIPALVFEAIMAMCIERGIVRDSRELLYGFHEDSSNPMNFSSDISPDEITKLVERKREHENKVCITFDGSNTSNLLELVRTRRSVRKLSDKAISREHVFGLLEAGYTLGERRSTPSAGKLYPLQIYLVVTNDNQFIERGVYRYEPSSISLLKTENDATNEQLARALDLPNVPGGIVVFIASDLSIGVSKYANRAYRYAFLEAGHVAQNMYLFAAETNTLGILEFGGFDDRAAAKLLDLNYPKTAIITTVIIGNKDDTAIEIDQATGTTLWGLRTSLVGPEKPVEWCTQLHTFGDDDYHMDKVMGIASYREFGGRKSDLANECYGLSTDSRIASIKSIAEAFERHASGIIRHDVVSSAKNIHGEWLDPRIFTPFQPQQYPFLSELEPFDPNKQYQWIRGYRYSTKTEILVPVEHAFYPVRFEDIGRLPCYSASSSGVAAHFDYATAVQRAMFELIERDAISVMWYAKRDVKKIAHEALPPCVRKRKERWEKLGWQVDLLDITTDSVPVVLALISSEHMYPHAVSGGSAATDYTTATSRSLEEAELMLVSWHFTSKRKGISANDVISTIDHGLIYFQPENLRWLDWLRNASVSEPKKVLSVDILGKFNPVVVDLKVANSSSELNVVRVMSEQLLPINFGYGCEHYRHSRLDVLGLDWNREYPSFPHLFA